MNSFFQHIFILFTPLIPTLILHMVVVKKNYMASWAMPISEKAFGTNKTWRGLVFVTFINGLLCMIPGIFLRENLLCFFLMGTSLGLAYILAELPNSYLKRRLKIPPGGKHPKYALLFLFIDKADSITAVLLVYYFLSDISLLDSFYIFIIALVLHLAISALLFKLKIKSAI